ncbi:MAG TPA: FUSC family protein [Stellaceae bacterium]|nr:FUSC family protein [Stellaceae bacterium]
MRAFLGTARRAALFDRTQLTVGLGLRLAPALLLVLAAGLALGEPQVAAVAAGGALIVGFGAFQQFTSSRAGPMLFAWLGTGLSTLIGTLAGGDGATMVLAAMIYAFWCGMLPAIGMGAFWIGQQCTIFLLIAGAYAGGIEQAFDRAALVMAGGLVQIACFTIILARERRALPWRSLHRILGDAATAFAGLRFHVRYNSPWIRFALHCALALAAAVVVERVIALPNGYWVAMTTLLLLRPDFQDALARSLGRIGGTIAGAALASLIAHVLAPGPAALATLVAAFAFLAYATVRFNYGVFSLFVTGYVVFLLVLAGVAEAQVAASRIESTAMGGVIALVAQCDFFVRYRARRTRPQTP